MSAIHVLIEQKLLHDRFQRKFGLVVQEPVVILGFVIIRTFCRHVGSLYTTNTFRRVDGRGMYGISSIPSSVGFSFFNGVGGNTGCSFSLGSLASSNSA